MATEVHPTAIIGSNTQLGDNVKVGPYCVIDERVTIGDGTLIGNFNTIKAGTTIGKNCIIFHNCSIGEMPQDIKYAGEETLTRIGDNVTIREAVTINRGTAAHGITSLGNNVLLMTGVHIAHDCTLGANVIFANLVTLGGHVTIGEWASLGGGVLVHQFTKIGAHIFVGGGYRIVQDIPPYILAAGEPLKYAGINSIGLKRRGFSADDRAKIKKAYRLFFRSEFSRKEVLEKIKAEFPDNPHVDSIIKFIASSDRGII